jgi:hypothetical protein
MDDVSSFLSAALAGGVSPRLRLHSMFEMHAGTASLGHGTAYRDQQPLDVGPCDVRRRRFREYRPQPPRLLAVHAITYIMLARIAITL